MTSTTHTQRRYKAGFTLLEILLTSLLTAIILMSLWSLSDIYLRLFVSGKKKIEEVQLVRGLTHQLSHDVAQVVQIVPAERFGTQISPASFNPSVSPIPPGNAAGTANRNPAANPIRPAVRASALAFLVGQNPPAVQPAAPITLSPTAERKSELGTPRFGLFGTKHTLRLLVLVADPLAFREPVDLSDVLPEPGQPRAPFASELRTIEYSFDSHRETGSSGQQRPSGLIRREWPWETWSGLRLAGQQLGGSISGFSMMPPEVAEWTAEDALAFENNQNVLHLPQVSALEFHYFDGVDWETEWNSAERQQLPRLVEVLFTVKRSETEKSTNPQLEESEEDDEPVSLSTQSTSGPASTQSTRHGLVYRQLIHLPAWDADQPAELPGQYHPMADAANPTRLVGARRP